ncbi:MAG: 30S ribosomal protein S15 [Phycisphaerae bacterium]
MQEVIKAKRRGAIETFRRHDKDTGSSEVQVAILTSRITHLTEHLKSNRQDHASQRGLMKMVGKRSALLKYLRRTDPQRYQKVIAGTGLRK